MFRSMALYIDSGHRRQEHIGEGIPTLFFVQIRHDSAPRSVKTKAFTTLLTLSKAGTMPSFPSRQAKLLTRVTQHIPHVPYHK